MNIMKGDIYYIENTRKTTGSEQAGNRPGIVVSNNVGNIHSDCVEVVWLTTKDKNPLPTHVEVMCRVPSTALCEQISTVSITRLDEFIRTCTDEEIKRIDDALMVSLGIEPMNMSKEESNLDTIYDLKEKLEINREKNIELAQINLMLEDDLKLSQDSFHAMKKDNELLEETLLKMEAERAELLKQISYLEGSVNDSAITKRMQLELVKAQAERDTYKEQFERLFERMIG